MEDALISPIGFMILSGAGLVEASESKPLFVHATEQTQKFTYTDGTVTITLEEAPAVATQDNGLSANEDYVYVMVLDENGEPISEPFIPTVNEKTLTISSTAGTVNGRQYTAEELAQFENATAVLVDYYVEKKSGAQQIEITPDKFGGNFYLEASTLFRDTNGVDMPAEFIIPNCKIQSNFTFTMASTGDPSTLNVRAAA